MKITLILLQSLDGYIAKDSYDDLSWGSKDDKRFFKEISTKINNVVMGGTTYKSMPEKVFESRQWFVFSNNPDKYTKRDNVTFVDGSASQVVKELESKGISELLIAGGSEIYSLFLKENLFDEIYLTIAPVILGSGIKGINTNENIKLKLLETISLNEQEVILHYSKA